MPPICRRGHKVTETDTGLMQVRQNGGTPKQVHRRHIIPMVPTLALSKSGNRSKFTTSSQPVYKLPYFHAHHTISIYFRQQASAFEDKVFSKRRLTDEDSARPVRREADTPRCHRMVSSCTFVPSIFLSGTVTFLLQL